jgi:hypothetical protein
VLPLPRGSTSGDGGPRRQWSRGRYRPASPEAQELGDHTPGRAHTGDSLKGMHVSARDGGFAPEAADLVAIGLSWLRAGGALPDRALVAADAQAGQLDAVQGVVAPAADPG